jgi:hypothetical protein
VPEVADEASRLLGSSADRVGSGRRAYLLPLGEGSNEDLMKFARSSKCAGKSSVNLISFRRYFFGKKCSRINVLRTLKKNS